MIEAMSGSPSAGFQAASWDGAPVSAEFLFGADFTRLGNDLVIGGADGAVLVVPGYFSAEPFDIPADNGGLLKHSSIEKLLTNSTSADVAQTGGEGAEAPIGEVVSLDGGASIQRAGTLLDLNAGDAVFQNDVVITGPGGSVGIGFIDGTVFSLSEGSRIILDTLVYDPGGSENTLLFTIMEGTFTFFAGQVARTGGMEVDTTVATIGVRGTTPTVSCDAAACEFGLLRDPDTGDIGRYTLTSLDGSRLFGTVSETGQRFTIDGATGQFSARPNTAVEQAEDDVRTGLIDEVFQSARTLGIELQSFGTEPPNRPGLPDGRGNDAESGPGGPQNGGEPGPGTPPPPFPPGQGPLNPALQPLNGRSGSEDTGPATNGQTGEADGNGETDALLRLPPPPPPVQDVATNEQVNATLPTAADDFFMYLPLLNLLVSGNGTANLLANDASNVTLSAVAASFSTAYGSVQIGADGNLSYSAPSSVDLALDTFGYTAENGAGTSAATVHVEVISIQGMSFNSYLLGDNAANTIAGTGNNDLISAFAGNDTVTTGAGNDAVSGGAGDDQIFGEGGDDALSGGAGNDYLDGGTGTDEAAYNGASSGVTVDLSISGAQAVGGGQGSDTLVSIEDLSGSDHGDILTGDGNANVILGQGGNDDITGGAGADTLDGMEGDDILLGGLDFDSLRGGTGADTFKFTSVNDGSVDTIEDFNIIEGDQLDLVDALAAFFGGEPTPGGFDLNTLVTIVDNGTSTAVNASVDGTNFFSIANMQGISAGDGISIIFNGTDTQTITVTV